MSGSDRPEVAQPAPDPQDPWVARVSSDRPASQSPVAEPSLAHLVELARAASDSARLSANLAQAAARTAALGTVAASRISDSPRDAQQVVRDLEEASVHAGGASAGAADDAALSRLGVQDCVDPIETRR